MRKALKIVLAVVICLVVLVVVAGFVGTRSWFLKSQILPRASAAVGMPITATDIHLSPFSRVEIVGLQVGADPTPLLKAGTIRVRYRLFPILRGDLKVDEVLLDQAQVQVVQEADGKSNLPPAPAAAKPAEKAPKSASAPLAIRPDVHNVQVRNLTILYDKKDGANPLHAELRSVNVTLPELRSGAPINLNLTADLKFAQGTQVKLDSGKLTADLTAALDGALLPTEVKLDGRLGHLSGMAQSISLADREVTLRATVTREGNAFTVGTFQIGGRAAGKTDLSVAVTGSVQPDPPAADLDIKIDPISPEVLNLAGALAGGLNFGRTHGSYAGHVTFRNGTELTAKGALRFSDITVSSPQVPALTPMDFSLDHDLSADLAGKSAKLTVLNANLAEMGQPAFFSLRLSQPVALTWAETGPAAAAASPAKLLVELNNLNLMLAAPFLPPKGPAKLLGGHLNGALTAGISQLGQQIEFNGNLKGSGIQLRLQDKTLPTLELAEELRGTLTNLRDLNATLSTHLRIAGQDAFGCQVAAKADLKTQDGAVDIDIETANQKLLAVLPANLAKLTDLVDAFNVEAQIKAAASDHARRLRMSGGMTVPRIQAHLPDGTRLPVVDKALRFDAVVDLPGSTVRVAELSADVKQEGRSVVTLQLTRPLAFCWAKTGAAGDDPAPAEIRLGIDRFGLALANPLLATAKTAFTTGTLSGNLNAAVGKLGNDLALTGSFSADGLELTTPQGTIKGLSIKEALDVRLQNLNALELRKQELEIRAGERPALRVETSGNVNLGDLAGQLDLVVPVFNENLFALVPTEAAKTLPKVERLTLTAKLAASVKDKGKTAAVTGTIDIPQATVDTGTVRTPPDLQAKMELDVEQAGGSEIRIRKFGVLATQAQKPVAHLAVDGTCYLPPVKKESTLTIRSDGADLKWLASLAPKAPPPVEKPAAPPAPRNVGPIGLTVEPAAVDLKGLWLTTKLDLRNLLYGELAVSELRGTTRVKDNTVEIKPLDIVINSAPFHLEALADLNQPGYKYQATAKLGTLRLEPFIATFAPAMRNQLQGQLKSFDLKAGGAGLTPANLSRNFVGGIDLQADQIKLQNLPALMEIATKTGVPELQTILFDKATVKMQNENGRMRLSDVALAGQELRMEVVGTVDFDARLDVQTRIGVGGNLENRLRLKLGPLFEPKQGDYSYLRTPIALKGYPGQQQPTQIVLSMIQQAIGQAATNALGAVIKSQLEGKKLDTKSLLGNFLNPGAASGTTAAPAAPATTTTPAGQATPAKASRNESLLNLLQSAVAQPAAAQTAAPGTATAPSAAPATAAQPAETQPPPAQPDQPKTEKQKRNDAVRDIGTSLFNSLLQGK